MRDFPGGPVVKTPHSQCRGFNVWSGNQMPQAATKTWLRQINLKINLKKFFKNSTEKSVIHDKVSINISSFFFQFSSVTQSCPTLCDPMDCSTSGFPVHHQLPELAQTHVHWVGDAIQPSHSLSFPSPPAFNLSQHQGLFKMSQFKMSQVAIVLELQFQHQSFQ